MPSYRIRIADDTLIFSAAHFLTLEGGVCEPLHGHNYRVTAEIEGPLNEQKYVVDFLVAHDALRAILRGLDHAVLLPAKHPSLQRTEGGAEVEVRWADRRWVFPRSDCRWLPLESTTAELLAEYIGQRLLTALSSPEGKPEAVSIEVEESPGHSAICRLRGE